MSQHKEASRPTSNMGLHLLLARAEDHRPVVEEGFAVESTREVPKPESLPRRIEAPTWERPDAAPNDLAAQRWGVIAPEGELGDSLLRVSEHREARESDLQST